MNFDMKAFGDKAIGFLKTAGEKAKTAAVEVKKRTDQAAEVLAAKVTEVTGRETTATEVKRAVVVVAGAAVLGTIAVGMANNGRRGVIETALDGGYSESDLAWGSDFESQAARMFAENGGSLNYYTPHVDSTGTVYYQPNG